MASKTTTKKKKVPAPQTTVAEDCAECEQSDECLSEFKSEFSQLVVDTRVSATQLADKYNIDKVAVERTLAASIQTTSPIMYAVLRTADGEPVTILQAEFVSVDGQGGAMLHLYVSYEDCFQTEEEAAAMVQKYREEHPEKYKKSEPEPDVDKGNEET